MDNRERPPRSDEASSSQAAQLMSMSKTTVAPASDSSAAPLLEDIHPNQQARRLQLRHAGFRGQTLPTRRISPILGASILSSEGFGRVVSNENSPHNLEKRLLYGEDLPPSPVNILQELHNSARRKRHLPRPSIGAIFQDDTATAPAEEDSVVSWYNEASNSSSPLQSRNTSIPMAKLRDISFNSRTPPPLSSPLTKQMRGRNGSRANARSTSTEAAKYIEHLESQLVAVNTKLDSLMSPTSHKARAAKLRALTSETRCLRQQVLDWESKFDERVKDERSQPAQVEMALTARLQILEDELEAKDNRARDLEWEMENLRSRVKNAEGLEAVNTDLERRIEVLTSLLVQSPTKLDVCSAASSPGKQDPKRRTPRPRSMMPRMPQSPGPIRLSLNTGSDMNFRQSRRSVASMTSPSPCSGPASEMAQTQPGTGVEESKDSSEMGSANSSSYRSPPSSSSRPTSLHSSGSFGAYCWGLPVPPDPDAQVLASQKQRRMRRFPSGTASLKPLILPSAAGASSLPASAPAQSWSHDTAPRNPSNVSLDPTVAFLSYHEHISPVVTPTQADRSRSASHAQREALSSLEGRSNPPTEKDECAPLFSPRSFSEEPLETVEEEASDTKVPKERPPSLCEELAKTGMLVNPSIEDGLIPFFNQGSSSSVACGSTWDEFSVSPSSVPLLRRRSRSFREPTITPKLKQKPPELPNSIPKATASTSISPDRAYGLLPRLKDVILRTKQGPSILARKLIYNAWVIGVAKLGGIGWWLLGLVYGTRWRKRKKAADAKTTVEEVPVSDSKTYSLPPQPHKSRTLPYDELEHGTRVDMQLPKTPTKAPPPPQAPSDILWHGKLNRHQSSGHGPHLVPCPDCREPSSRRSLRLWLRFSLAIVFAVGLAIKDGPGVLLEGYQASGEEHHVPTQPLLQNVRHYSVEESSNRAPKSSPAHVTKGMCPCRCANDSKTTTPSESAPSTAEMSNGFM
ncbi:MAG: hypothetical protein Q9222_005668 [Ikaeria aurantiellina]